MGQLALGAASLASRVSRGRAIVVAADGFDFPAGMVVGEELSVFARIERTGRSSMTIATQGWRRERDGEGVSRAASGRFVFVAVDGNNQPRPLDTEQEKEHG